MPKRKAPKRKVKEVIVPEGDEGTNLTKLDRSAKLESFIEQFKEEVEGKLKEMDKDYEDKCFAIENAGRSLLVALTPREAEMSILEYRKRLLKPDGKRESEVEGAANVSAILKDIDNFAQKQTKAATKGKGKKVTGFATPAAASQRHTLWTATPKDTPLFDKRLLNVAGGKPSGLSFQGQPIDVGTMSQSNKQELTQQLNSLLRRLK